MINNSEINNLLNGLSERLNTTPEQLRANLEKGNLDSVVSKMSSGQAKRLQKILDNPQQSEKILNSPQAQAIIKKLMG
ncbi:MAG: hypothetical protein PUE67_00450 [Oscillospiraceae bacterium]|nr:hypothetical protein [Oscillospiraceae bacterium]